MRILQIGPIPPEVGGLTRGGVATHLWGLSVSLREQGHHVAILADNYFARKEWPTPLNSMFLYGVGKPLKMYQKTSTLHPSMVSRMWRLKKHFGSQRSLKNIAAQLLFYDRVINHFQPEVIHVHHLENRFPFAHFVTQGRLPLVTTIHSTHFIEFGDPSSKETRRQFVQKNLLLSKNLIFVSQYVRRRYEDLFFNGLKGRRAWIIHNPVDISRFHSLNQMEARRFINKDLSRPVVLFVGSLISRKGIYDLVDATARLRRARGLYPQLVIVGDGPDKNKLLESIMEQDLISTVFLEGVKSQQELLYYYNSADIFVLPSHSEGFALALIEAIACGCPIIGTRGIADELITSEEYGYLVPSNDGEALAQSIEQALAYPWDREKIRRYALTFDWKTKIHSFEMVYNEIVHSAK